MFKKLFKSYFSLQQSKLFWIFNSIFFFSMLAVALFYQFYLNHPPCPICVLIRSFVLGMAIVSSIMIFFRNEEFLLFGLMALILLGSHGLIFSIESYQIEIGQIISSCSLDSPFPSWFPLSSAIPFLFDPTGLCGTSPVMWFGLTMNEILVIVLFLVQLNFVLLSIPHIIKVFFGNKRYLN